MLKRALAGDKVTQPEYDTLLRAERLHVSANSPGFISRGLSLLEAGKNPFGFGGMSDSRLIGKLAGFEADSRPTDRVSARFDHGPRR